MASESVPGPALFSIFTLFSPSGILGARSDSGSYECKEPASSS